MDSRSSLAWAPKAVRPITIAAATNVVVFIVTLRVVIMVRRLVADKVSSRLQFWRQVPGHPDARAPDRGAVH